MLYFREHMAQRRRRPAAAVVSILVPIQEFLSRPGWQE
jgi:hypothetical protein